MSHPHVTYVVAHGKRIYSVETPLGFVHLIACRCHAHLSEAIHSLRLDANPVAVEQEVED